LSTPTTFSFFLLRVQPAFQIFVAVSAKNILRFRISPPTTTFQLANAYTAQLQTISPAAYKT
jgi:hypothetical protein